MPRRSTRAFWLLAIAFAFLMAFTTVPTPMYPLYQELDDFPTVVTTVIFGAYGFGVMAGLYFAGHLSDRFGRKPLLFASVLAQLVAVIMFLLWEDEAALIVARFICGVGIGTLTSTATAALTELRAGARPDESGGFAATVASVVNLGGLSLGPLIGGILVEWAPWPLRLPYFVFLALILAAAAVVLTTPETVPQSARAAAWRYRPQRVVIEPGQQSAFLAAAFGAGGSFAATGFVTALTATLLATILGTPSAIIAGLTVFGLMAASAASQIVLARLAARPKLIIGLLGMLLGIAGIATAGAMHILWLYIVAAVVTGAGVGLVFSSSIAFAARVAHPEHRSSTIAGMFLAAYAGITIPVIACGVALSWLSAEVVVVAFGVAVAAIVTWSTLRMIRAL